MSVLVCLGLFTGPRFIVQTSNVNPMTPRLPVRYFSNYKVQVRVGGKSVTLNRPQPNYGLTRVVSMGSDQSFLFLYDLGSNTPLDYWVWHRGKKQKINVSGYENTNILRYRNRNNYVGTVIRTMGPKQMPLSESKAFRVKDGKFELLGDGNLLAIDYSTIVLDCPVDREGKPIRRFDAVSDQVKVRSGKHEGVWPDATFLRLSKGVAYILDGQDLVAWKEGRVLSSRKIPSGWHLQSVNDEGDVALTSGEKLAIWEPTGIHPVPLPPAVQKGIGDSTTEIAGFDSRNRLQLSYWREDKVQYVTITYQK